jgi:O-antigen/teichoic acid export membrane protein
VLGLISVGNFVMQYRSDAYFIAAIVGAQGVAAYHIGLGLSQKAFSALVPKAGGMMLLGAMTEAYAREGRPALHRYFSRMVKYVLLANLPIALGGAILAREIVYVVYGESYLEAAGIVALFFLVTGPLTVGGAISGVLSAIERPDLFMWTKVLTVVNIGLNVLLIPVYGVAGALYATAASSTLILAVEYLLARRLTGITFPAGSIIRTLGAAGAMAAVVIVLQRALATPQWATLAIVVPIGAIVYLTAVLLLRAAGEDELRLVESRLPFIAHLTTRLPGHGRRTTMVANQA